MSDEDKMIMDMVQKLSEKSVEQLFTPSFLKVKTGDKSLPE